MNFNETITETELDVCRILIKFIEVASNGITKPYSHEHYLNTIDKIAKEVGADLSIAAQCCMPSADVREAKELKPYIMAAANRIADILKLEL